jgi:hypothetical protein
MYKSRFCVCKANTSDTVCIRVGFVYAILYVCMYLYVHTQQVQETQYVGRLDSVK